MCWRVKKRCFIYNLKKKFGLSDEYDIPDLFSENWTVKVVQATAKEWYKTIFISTNNYGMNCLLIKSHLNIIGKENYYFLIWNFIV